MDTELRRTPLYACHVELSARIVDFAGWAMPVLYTGILEEARAVRNQAGIFDISHMGRTIFSGEGATALLQSLTTNDVEGLKPGEAHYSLLTNPQGGMIDDIIVYREAGEKFLVVINASNTEKDLAWFRSHAPASVTIDDQTEQTAMIAIQGPEAPALTAKLAQNPSILDVGRFHFVNGAIAGTDAILCRTGYTGEDGFELIVPASSAAAVWKALLDAGAVPCGLGARDALRIEAGYPLYGHEIDDTTTPVEAGLMWVVKLEKGDFTGSDIIRKAKEEGPKQRLVGILLQDRIQPRQGYTIFQGDEEIGHITSGIFSPIRNHSVAMGYVATSSAKTGTPVEVEIRGKRIAGTVVPKKDLLKS